HDLLAIEPGPADVRGHGVDPLLEKHQVFRLFRQSLPPPLALATERFPARQWAVLRMVQEREEALDVLEQNPVLGFCTANLARFRNLSGNLGQQAAELSRRPQRDVLGWLGFPDSQAWVNLFRKILPETVTVERMLALREVAGDEDMAKRLAHVPTINTGVLELTCQPRLLSLITPTLLAEIASAEEERLRGAAVHLLADLVDTLRRMNEPPQFGGIRTLAGLRERGQEINAAYQRHMLMREQVYRTLRFPPPPIAGTDLIVPLTKPGQLLEEGRRQHNCVGNYGERVAAGKVFIYRVLKPDRATLSLRPAANGEWEIEQLLRACNKPVSLATANLVQRWLAQESVSI
ncbi:MAG: PcfJ domain-containing protein, partial [Limisphaerales bacterium]